MALYGGLTEAQWQELRDAGFGAQPGGSFDSAEDQFRDGFPAMSFMLDVSPEIKSLILKDFDASTGGFDEQKFWADLVNTDWFQKTGANARAWMMLEETDPASAANRVQNKAHEIGMQMGIPMNQTGYLRDLATIGFQFDLSDAQMLEMAWTAIEQGKVKGIEKGATGAARLHSRASVKDMAKAYMIELPGKDLVNYSKQLATGRLTPETLSATLQKRSRAKWAHLSDQFDAGVTPEEFFSDHRQSIASLMEVPQDQVDLMTDNDWKAVTSYNDEGTIRPMTITETEQYVRTNKRWGETKQAGEQASGMAETLLRTFGQVK